MKKTLSIMTLLAITLFQASCDKDDDSSGPIGPDKTGVEWKGIGESLETPTGTPFNLPAGIGLAGIIKGYNTNDCGCDKDDAGCQIGTGDLVKVCLGLTNTTNKPITVTFPKGLIIISMETETQNGLVIQVETIEIPADQTVYYSLGAYCLNSERNPAFVTDVFEFGPVTQNAKLKELMTMVANKRLDNIETRGVLQAALWNITDGDGLTDFDRQYISSIPNK